MPSGYCPFGALDYPNAADRCTFTSSIAYFFKNGKGLLRVHLVVRGADILSDERVG
ncbi:MAG: hypothetical protein HY785_05385 [Oscillatoriophycideae cyanobacterium NC_groundwater_1537_Pr4_S-0.65um_50_18]|nr:hypothetical protein [Oscillatoriophycideae cyanobacterium NC_groundwater_1537_Pr4_S-0.65um_50_18]